VDVGQTSVDEGVVVLREGVLVLVESHFPPHLGQLKIVASISTLVDRGVGEVTQGLDDLGEFLEVHGEDVQL
jgi:hypothetical protein